MNNTQYLKKACESLNFNSPILLRANKYYKRNRVIDKAVSLMVADNHPFFFDHNQRLRVDKIECEDRARHYGLPIGSVLHKGYPAFRDIDIRKGRMKKILKSSFDYSILQKGE